MKFAALGALLLCGLVAPAGTRVEAAGASPRAAGSVAPTFDPSKFTNPVANPYLPLVPVTTCLYESETEEGLVRTEVTVTADTRPILGVDAVVVHDVVWLDVAGGPTVLREDTLDWYSSDNVGNVWYLGESTVEYLYDAQWNQIGSSTEGTWLAGLDGAEPGVIMPAAPRPGVAYRQEFYAGVAEDMARTLRLNAKVVVPYGSFENTLITKEWTKLDPGAIEQKYYAPGIGLVLVEELKGKGTVREKLVDVQMTEP